ncbi:MAG: Smr/MutS family protein [Gammaproteobacteria bacterium]
MSDEPKRFADLVGKVRRLEHDTVHHERPRPVPRRRQREDEPAVDDTWSHAPEADDLAERDDYHRPGIQHGLLRKLRRGQFPVESSLDLHGLRLEEARRELAHFLATAGGPRLRCVRVVHGKGMSSPGLAPVLKPNVRHWLRQDARVLAWVAVRDSGGGSGAVDVLLRAR